MTTQIAKTVADRDDHRDPITGAPGYHPVGTSAGALGGAVAGGAVGSVAGPVGTAVGIAVGAVVGGLTGKAVAEAADPTSQDAWWQEHYRSLPYVDNGAPYEHYRPAFRAGYEGYSKYPASRFEDVENKLANDFEETRGESPLSWEQARYAARDAWLRLEKLRPAPNDTL